MVSLVPFSPALRQWITRHRTQHQQESQPPPPQQGNPLKNFPTLEELGNYPPPASFVVEGTICDQRQSPLFSKIPPEVRNEIFRLALNEYVPDGREWDPMKDRVQNPGYGNVKESSSFVKRPGYEGLKTVDTDLLRTCKRVYEETKLLPLQDLEVCFYMGHRSRAPEHYTMTAYTGMNTYAHPRVNWFKPEHWARIRHYHIFSQMFALEQGFQGLFRNHLDLCQPTSIVLTLRYSDFWFWEFNQPIHPIQPHHFFPMCDIQLPPTVQRIEVEFESIEPKLGQLQALVLEMFQRKDIYFWKRRDGKQLTICEGDLSGHGTKTWRWTGPSKLGGTTQRYPHHGEADSMVYVVKVVTWQLDGARRFKQTGSRFVRGHESRSHMV